MNTAAAPRRLVHADPPVGGVKELELIELATDHLKNPKRFWAKKYQNEYEGPELVKVASVPAAADRILAAALPEDGLPYDHCRRAGLGSPGRPGFVALATWRGGQVARQGAGTLELAMGPRHARAGRHRPDPLPRVLQLRGRSPTQPWRYPAAGSSGAWLTTPAASISVTSRNSRNRPGASSRPHSDLDG